MKHKIHIKALSSEGKKVLETKEDDDMQNKAARFVCGVKEKVVCEDPYTIEVTMRKVPKVVFEMVLKALEEKFIEKGLSKNDFEIGVV